MDWKLFLSSLFEDGRIVVPPVAAISSGDLQQLRDALQPYEALHRNDQVGGLPSWDPDAGSWAAAMLLRAVQFAVFRDLGERAIKLQLGGEEPAASGAAHYSVDVSFQFLPDVLAFARAASPEDPLVKRLVEWAANWPLSSVGVPNVKADPSRVEAIMSDDALARMYADRVLARDDATRLDVAAVEAVVRERLGNYDTLAGQAIRQRLAEASMTEPKIETR